MMRQRGIAALALVGWMALILQLWLVVQARWALSASLVGGVINFLSYFTVLSNILAASVLSAWAWPSGTAAGRWLRSPSVAGCALVSILLVGIAYNLLLRTLWAPEGAQWLANQVLHNLMPPAFLAFWWWCVPKRALRWRQVALWALYPLGWYGFTLLRGWAIGVWPYPFIDVLELGFTRALFNALGLFAVFCLGGLGVVGVDHWLGVRRLGCHPCANSRQP